MEFSPLPFVWFASVLRRLRRPPFSAVAKAPRTAPALLGRYGHGLRSCDRFFVSELGRFARFRSVVARAYRVLLAGFMSALVALLGSGPVALGCPLVVIRGIDVCIFRH
jgi:hypothetical protein